MKMEKTTKSLANLYSEDIYACGALAARITASNGSCSIADIMHDAMEIAYPDDIGEYRKEFKKLQTAAKSQN